MLVLRSRRRTDQKVLVAVKPVCTRACESQCDQREMASNKMCTKLAWCGKPLEDPIISDHARTPRAHQMWGLISEVFHNLLPDWLLQPYVYKAASVPAWCVMVNPTAVT
jgi:hypothetical protein